MLQAVDYEIIPFHTLTHSLNVMSLLILLLNEAKFLAVKYGESFFVGVKYPKVTV